jgi:hypothetical protein
MRDSPYADPELWEEAKRAARERLGGHSARAMQLAGDLYRRAGGRYKGRKTAAQRSLTKWTKQDWTTRSGKPSRETGERYLPRKVLERLSPAEIGATTRAKRAGTRAGKQFVAQPPKIRAKVARLKREINPMARTPTPAQIAARERFAEMARSGAFRRKKNPMIISKQADESLSRKGPRGYLRELLDRYSDDGHVVSVKITRSGSTGISFDGGRLLTAASARKKLEDHYGITKRKAAKARKANPVKDVANIIFEQLGGNRFAMMTGAKNFVSDSGSLMFSIPKNKSVYNRVRLTLSPHDTYDVEFLKIDRKGIITKSKELLGVFSNQLQSVFEQTTGLRTSLGTMGRRKANPSKKKVVREKPPFYYLVKVGQSYDGQFSSMHYSLDDVKRIAQQKADKYGQQAQIRELHR